MKSRKKIRKLSRRFTKKWLNDDALFEKLFSERGLTTHREVQRVSKLLN